MVYVGTVNPKHVEACKMMFEAGKSVLCEKPLTCSAADTRDLITAAREKGVFFMEVRSDAISTGSCTWCSLHRVCG